MRKEIAEHKKTILTYIFIALAIAIATWFLSDASPRYVCPRMFMNADYYNFTKSILNGKVLYKDLSDHKGIYLFALWMPALIISQTSTWGVYIEECILMLVLFHSASLFYKAINERVGRSIPPILSAAVVTGLEYFINLALLNTEVIMLAVFNYLSVWLMNGRWRKYKKADYFLIGVLFAYFIFSKFIGIVSIFPVFVGCLCLSITKDKNTKAFVKMCMYSLLGAIIGSLPAIIYHYRTGTIDGLIREYLFSGATNVSLFTISSLASFILSGCIIIAVMTIPVLCGEMNKAYIYACTSFMFMAVMNCASSFSPYRASVNIGIVPLCIFYCLPKINKRTQILIVAIIASMTAIMVKYEGWYPAFVEPFADNGNVKEIQAEYPDLTTDNMMVVGTEDTGVTCFDDHYISAKYIWAPTSIQYKEDEELYKIQSEYISNKRFKYILTTDGFEKGAISYLEDEDSLKLPVKTEYCKCCIQLQCKIDKYYRYAEEIDTGTTTYYLYMAK